MTRSSRSSRSYRTESLSDYQSVDLSIAYKDRQEFQPHHDHSRSLPQNNLPQESARGAEIIEAETKALKDSVQELSGVAPTPAHNHPAAAGVAGRGAEAAIDPLAELAADLAASHKAEQQATVGVRRDPAQAWQMVREDLLHSLPAEAYSRFVEKAWVLAYEDGEFIIGVPDAYTADWLDARLRQNLKRGLGRYLGRQSIEVIFRVRPRPVNDDAEIAELPLFHQDARVAGPAPALDAHGRTVSSELHDSPLSATGQIPDIAADIADLLSHSPADPDAGRAAALRAETTYDSSSTQSILAEQTAAPPEKSAFNIAGGTAERLQPEYTFDTFVVGDHNRLAHAAATAITEAHGKSFNPLFIYGGVGLGKTHLLHAIGNSVRRKGRQVLYRSSEQFTNELIQAIMDHSTDEFREKYRRVDVLLIDDIQFIGGKERTQEEFFHTFNHLYELGSQIVLTSDRPPKALATLEERLRSRFEGGLQTDIAPPDIETRAAILERKAQRLGMKIDHRVLMAVAERFESNIRELEGALNQLCWQSQLANIPLTYESAVAIVENLAPQRRPCSPPDVIRVLAHHFGVTPADIMGKSRKQPIAHIRQIVMYLLREENGLSLQQVGDELGGRDHSTVRYGAERIVAELQTNDALRSELVKLREKIYRPLH